MPNKTDDKDDWEKEDTFLDKYHRQKELKKAAKAATASIAKDSFGIVGTMERMSSVNDYIAKALETNPQGWMVTSIKVSDPQLIATLHHAMRGYYQ